MNQMIRTFQLMINFYISSIALSGYGEVRLSGGSSNNSGTLEVSATEASWTTVCLDGFDGAAATVVCRQLGYDHGSYYPTDSDQTINVCEIECTGHEEWIRNCKIVWRLYECLYCLSNDVVGISCSFNSINPTTHDIRRTNHNCTNDGHYKTGNTSMPGVIAGAVGGITAFLILVAFIIGYLTYKCYAQAAAHRSNGREFHNDDSTSEPGPPPYQLPVSVEKMSIHSTNSVPRTTLSDPPPNYSSLA